MGLYATFVNACSRAFQNRQALFQRQKNGHYNLGLPSPGARKQTDTLPISGTAQQIHTSATPVLFSNETASAPAFKVRTQSAHDNHQTKNCRRVRMVISGRMADVCAELERLVALDNQMNTSTHH